MSETIDVKPGETISRVFTLDLPTGSAWQARAQIRHPQTSKVWDVTMTLAERVGAPGTWDGTFVVASTATATFPPPREPGQIVLLFCDIQFYVDGAPDTVVTTATFAVAVQWTATR